LTVINYEEILDQARQLSSVERLRLADALLEEELGFGMWRHRAEMKDAVAYVERLRHQDMRTAEGGLKTPEEFLREVEAFDE
jgi:hypothetical protein